MMASKQFNEIQKIKKQMEDKKKIIQKHQSEYDALNQRLVSEEHKYMMELLDTHNMSLEDVTDLVIQFAPSQSETEEMA